MTSVISKNKAFLASAGLILAAAIWGFAFVVVKDSLDYIGPVWMIAFRFTIAAVCLSLIFIRRWKKLNPQTLTHGAILGVLIFTAYFFQTVGCKYTTAGKNAFLTTTYVILVPLMCWPVYKKRPTWHVALAAVICILGIGLLSLGGESAGEVSAMAMNIGDILTLICGIFYAVHIVCISHFTRTEDPILLTILQFLFTAISGWLWAPFWDGAFPVAALHSSRVVGSLLFLGIFSTMVSYVLQNVGLKYVPSALGSLFMSLESVFGVLFGALCLGEKLTLRMWIGTGLIFLAIVLAEVIPKISFVRTESEDGGESAR